LPDHALPTTAQGRHIRRPTSTALTQQPTAQDDTADKWWFEIINAPTSIQTINQGITNGTAVWVTDGSFKGTYGTAGSILLPTINLQDGLLLVNQTPGREDDIDAYRAEAAGIYGYIAFTNKLMKHHQLEQGGVTMACDCLLALKNIFEHKFDKPSQPHYDLLHSCRLLIAQSPPATLQSRHVRGHQDDHGSYEDLDRWKQSNVDMDT
jgi:hypothetical protein